MDPDPYSEKCMDPDPEIMIRTQFFCLLLFEGTFTSFFKDKKS
jgi:hypothetical protein